MNGTSRKVIVEITHPKSYEQTQGPVPMQEMVLLEEQPEMHTTISMGTSPDSTLSQSLDELTRMIRHHSHNVVAVGSELEILAQMLAAEFNCPIKSMEELQEIGNVA